MHNVWWADFCYVISIPIQCCIILLLPWCLLWRKNCLIKKKKTELNIFFIVFEWQINHRLSIKLFQNKQTQYFHFYSQFTDSHLNNIKFIISIIRSGKWVIITSMSCNLFAFCATFCLIQCGKHIVYTVAIVSLVNCC